MAITWKNIAGPNFGAANQLLSNASSQVGQGLQDITNVAKDVSDEQIRQYDTQAGVNTAGILSNINRLDQLGIDSFNVEDLEKQYGTQYDPSQIARALDTRADELRGIEQLAKENLLAQSNLDLNKQRTDASVAASGSTVAKNNAAKELRDKEQTKQETISTFSNSILSSLGEFNSNKDLQNAISRKGSKAGLNSQEVDNVSASLSNLYAKNIEVSPEQQQQIERYAIESNDLNQLTTQNKLKELDREAEANGLSPILLNIKDDTSITVADVKKEWDPKVKDANAPWVESSVASVESMMTTELGRPPTAGELKYFLPFFFESGTTGDDAFNFEPDDSAEWKNYKNMLLNKSAEVKAYNKGKAFITQASKAVTKAQTEGLSNLTKKYRSNNASRFKEQVPTEDIIFDPSKYVKMNKALSKVDWFR
tara:strand:- start:52933 stop:54204 length:1272 start_codon:yes stop_codon:yes gene_type:complete